MAHPHTEASPGIFGRIAMVRRSELHGVAWSFAYFFCLLCSYYILRPVRDEMGIQGGVENLQWTFTWTFVAMLAAVPAFGFVASRYPRRKLLPLVYWFFVANLLVFFALVKTASAPSYVARAFFVWVSVFNLFVVSVFWSFMVDLFSTEQSRRLFGLIAAGGTAGALAGPALTAALAEVLGPANLLLVSASFLAAAVGCIHRLVRWADTHERNPGGATESAAPLAPAPSPGSGDAPVGGGVWSGVRIVLESPYLLGICLYMLLYTLLSTVLYFEQAHLVRDTFSTPETRTRLFASMDLAVNMLTLLGQLFLTGRIVARFGVALTLAMVPALTALGFAALGLAPVLAVLVVFQVMRRAGDFALARPAREMLFTVVSREAKYKSKNLIDTLVYRGGDAASGWVYAGLAAAGAGFAGIAWIAVPVAAAWLVTGVALGRKQVALGACRT